MDGKKQPYELSKETFKRQRTVYRTLHPPAGRPLKKRTRPSLAQVHAGLEAYMDDFLRLSPPE